MRTSSCENIIKIERGKIFKNQNFGIFYLIKVIISQFLTYFRCSLVLALHRAAGPYEDTRTGPNQVLRPNKVPRTGSNKFIRPKKDLKIGLNCKF